MIASASTDKLVPESFITKNLVAGRVGVFLEMEVKHGKDISTISAAAKEKEVLLLPGATFRVKSITPYNISHQNTKFPGYKVKMVQER